MPDVWTYNKQKLRDAIEIVGGKCDTESRVLHPRDPKWTCQLDGEHIGYDIYIHHAADLITHPKFLSMLFVFTVIGIVLGFVWGRRPWHKHSV